MNSGKPITPLTVGYGNPERSPVFGGERAETRPRGRTPLYSGGSARPRHCGDEIVQSQKKFWGYCNRGVAGSSPARGAKKTNEPIRALLFLPDFRGWDSNPRGFFKGESISPLIIRKEGELFEGKL